jgi:hypothetical protein
MSAGRWGTLMIVPARMPSGSAMPFASAMTRHCVLSP